MSVARVLGLALVRKGGLEPPWPSGHRILSPARLPVPPLSQHREHDLYNTKNRFHNLVGIWPPLRTVPRRCVVGHRRPVCSLLAPGGSAAPPPSVPPRGYETGSSIPVDGNLLVPLEFTLVEHNTLVNTGRTTTGDVVDRREAIHAYQENRARTAALFDLVNTDAYYDKPIPLRHPIVFYEGHIPAFSVNCFLKKALGDAGIDPDLEMLFARGIDPGDTRAAAKAAVDNWPRRDAVRQYAEEGRSSDSQIPRNGCHRGRCESCALPRAGRLHDARARGDASGNTSLHVAPAGDRAEASSGWCAVGG